ncbi:MAG: hypothetical protein GF390_03770 [Candidatus Pacebacteria bacterium]|nr:hypothetical protein [Candidatus Paceibacterota bacterium]
MTKHIFLKELLLYNGSDKPPMTVTTGRPQGRREPAIISSSERLAPQKADTSHEKETD